MSEEIYGYTDHFTLQYYNNNDTLILFLLSEKKNK